MTKLTAAQTNLINKIKAGSELTTYRNHNRCVLDAGTNSGKVVNANTVKKLINSGLLLATETEHGHILTVA